jgi:hypothetical protein
MKSKNEVRKTRLYPAVVLKGIALAGAAMGCGGMDHHEVVPEGPPLFPWTGADAGVDAGLVGPPVRDGGGGAVRDAGTPTRDAGTAARDAGTALRDAGTPVRDAGTGHDAGMRHDAGIVHDAGTPDAVIDAGWRPTK